MRDLLKSGRSDVPELIISSQYWRSAQRIPSPVEGVSRLRRVIVRQVPQDGADFVGEATVVSFEEFRNCESGSIRWTKTKTSGCRYRSLFVASARLSLTRPVTAFVVRTPTPKWGRNHRIRRLGAGGLFGLTDEVDAEVFLDLTNQFMGL
jgi:hypothetical protein